MKILHRLFNTGIEPTLEQEKKAAESKQRLERERQEYRQIVQRVNSGARLMEIWDDANRMLTNNRGQ